MGPEKPLQAILRTISEAREFAAELSDKVLELGTESELLDKVPVVSWAVKAMQVRDIYASYRLKRNCRAFIEALAKCDRSEVARLRSDLEADPRASEEFADTTVSILLEAQKPLKARVYGRLLKARIESQLTHAEFEDLSLLVQAVPVPALQALPRFFQRTSGREYCDGGGTISEEPLLMCSGVASRHGNQLRVSPLGQKLYRLGIEDGAS